ncbi:MAG: hypothetical protein OHK0046_18530 [Anaerolineae bacterium]
MAKPLHLPIKPPYAHWTLDHAYGLTSTPPFEYKHFVMLTTTTPGAFYAPFSGNLSVIAPRTAYSTYPGDPLELTDESIAFAGTVTLYLHGPLGERLTQAPFIQEIAGVGNLIACAFINVETASLLSTLGDLLDRGMLPTRKGGEKATREKRLQNILAGDDFVFVPAGRAIGQAASTNPGTRRLGIAMYTDHGTHDPAFIFDALRDFVEDNAQAMSDFAQFIPKRWPQIDATLNKQAAIASTQGTLYPYTVLQDLRQRYHLTHAEWRQIRAHQKALYRARLLQRAGHAPAGDTTPAFDFDDADAWNPFQLEAVTEFYLNYADPWKKNTTPRNPTDPEYIEVDLFDPEGSAATVNDTTVTLDQPLSDNMVRWLRKNTGDTLYDTLYLAADSNPARPAKHYRILDITNLKSADNTTLETRITLDAAPTVNGPTAWRIFRRPSLVLIDPFGPRLRGMRCTVQGNVITLDTALSKINRHFDTIYLRDDTTQPTQNGRPKGTYRILGYDLAAKRIVVDDSEGTPALPGGTSRWVLQSGVSGELLYLKHNLNVADTDSSGYEYFDHYDGMLFVVQNGVVLRMLRWTSYTSLHNKEQRERSSVRGNAVYEYESFYSSNSFINYAFSVRDLGAAKDFVADARYYFGKRTIDDIATVEKDDGEPDPTIDDPSGKSLIRIHNGNRSDRSGTGSAGCIVSPNFYELRDLLIRLYQEDYKRYHGVEDASVNAIKNKNAADSKTLTATGTDWNTKLAGLLWLIRPDERPLG